MKRCQLVGSNPNETFSRDGGHDTLTTGCFKDSRNSSARSRHGHTTSAMLRLKFLPNVKILTLVKAWSGLPNSTQDHISHVTVRARRRRIRFEPPSSGLR